VLLSSGVASLTAPGFGKQDVLTRIDTEGFQIGVGLPRSFYWTLQIAKVVGLPWESM
jgi:hypothetical protein